MQIRRLRVRNFRSIREEAVEFGAQTALLGPNGAGKSTILRALDRFYGQSTQMDPDDFFGRNFADPIEIAVTFGSLSGAELEQFGSRVQGGEMTVVRIFEAGTRNTGRFHGMASQHAGFQPVRTADNGVLRRQTYTAIRNQGGIYADLAAAANADQVTNGMAEWEQNHPDQCEPMLDDGQFFGFTNVAKGMLNKASMLVFIPAIRDVVADAADSKGAVVAQLIELLVRSAIQRRNDVRDWQTKASEEYRALTNPENLHELGELSDQLSDTLRVFYRDAAVALQWKPAGDLTVPLPTADVLLDDDGFEGPVDRKGHGLQRALILTLLQHLAVAVSANANEPDQEGAEEPQEEMPEAEGAGWEMPGLILAVEEPELYQHPTKQRHFASVLTRLSSGTLPGVATNTQVIFASHSPLFISTDRFDEIRLARRRLVAGQDFKECHLSSASLDQIARRLETIHAVPDGNFNGESVRARLHVLHQEVAEGFFADLAVLVEGPGDKAALLATAGMLGIDLEGLGVAILPIGGKTQIDRPALIFEALGIPTFVLWDCDNGEAAECNRALLRMCGVPGEQLVDAVHKIEPRFACFEDKLETILEAEIADLEAHINAVREAFGIQKKAQVLKSEFAMREVLNRAGQAGQRSATVENVVQAIAALMGHIPA